MPTNLRNSGNDGPGSDDWLSGSGEFDWGDEPTGQSRPLGTRTAGRAPAGDDPLWPADGHAGGHPDEETIRRRRIALLGGLLAVAVVIVVAVVAFGGGSDGDPVATQPVTTPAAPPPPPPPTTTTKTTATTPPAATVTLPDGESLQVGATGAEVKTLQQALITLGLLEAGSADGDFGAATANAVGEFQRAHGLPDDGVVGPATAEALNTALAAEAGTAAGA